MQKTPETSADKKTAKKGFFHSKKFRYGSTATAFTVAVIALVVFVNAIFSALASQYAWYIDMTQEQLYDISDASHALLDYLNDRDDVDIHIIFCTTRDKLESTYYQNLILQCALLYERTFDFVTVDYLDLVTHPAQANPYKTTAGSDISSTSIIISNEATKSFRLMGVANFFSVAASNNAICAFSGELKMTANILALVEKNPIAYFTTNHGETTDSSRLWELLETAGYDVRTVDLTKEELDPDEAQLVIINGPHYDFCGAKDAVNEIARIADFLDNYGNLMIFMDPAAMADKTFPNLNEFMEEWGISFGQSVVKDMTNSLSADGTTLVAEYTTDGGEGSQLHNSIRALDSVPKTIVEYAAPIELLWQNGEKNVDQSTRYVSQVLTSSAGASAYAFGDDETPVGTAPYTLMTLTKDVRYVDNEPCCCFVLACGTTEFVAQKYVESNAYGNADIVYAAMTAMGKTNVPADIDLRFLENDALVITTSQAYAWTAVVTGVIPLVCIVIGIVVCVRRRRL